jgi:glycosyltransferase involved in cell wall biosynthesis
MKLLVISSHYPPMTSPESAHTLLLCEQLAARGVEVDLLTSELKPGAPPPQGFRLHPWMRFWGDREFPRLMMSIRRLRPDAVLLIYIDWIYDCEPMVTFAPAVLRRLRPEMPFVTQFENISGLSHIHPQNRIRNRIMRWVLRGVAGTRGLDPVYGSLLRDSSRIIALSERHLEVFERAHPGVTAKANVIPAPPIMRLASESEPGSARKRGRAILGVAENDILLTYFGYVYAMKGVDTLIRAFPRLPFHTRLAVIGGSEPNYLKGLQELSHDVGGAERVIWTGHCNPEEDTASIYLHASDICVLPFNDGVRLNNSSFAVAAAHGLPIVSTRGEVLEPPFRDGENVRLCPPKDPAALSAAIAELIHSPELRSRLGSGARKLAEEHFSWDRVIQATLKTLAITPPK